MPQYTFLCSSCQIQFHRRLSIGDHPSHPCPSCRDPSPRFWEGQGFGFGFTPTEATARANSGVTKHDYPTADEAIGRSADAKWATIHARNAAKAKIRDKGVALSRRDLVAEGHVVTEYTSLGSPEFEARKRLEGRFKAKVSRDGIRTDVSTTPKKKAG